MGTALSQDRGLAGSLSAAPPPRGLLGLPFIRSSQGTGLLTWPPAVTSGLCPHSPLPSGVLEKSTDKDRPAVEKAKMLYRSCMNKSEWAPGSLSARPRLPGGALGVCRKGVQLRALCREPQHPLGPVQGLSHPQQETNPREGPW